MDPILTDEQRLLQDSVAKHFAQAGGVKRMRALRGKEGGFDRVAHTRMADEGWFGMMVPAERDGLGMGLTELALVLVEAGRVLAPEPIGATVAVASAIGAGKRGSESDALLAAIVAGRSLVMPAVSAGADGKARSVEATGSGGRLRLDGTHHLVPLAPVADGFLVAASRGKEQLLVHVPAGAQGLQALPRATVDGRPVGDLRFSGVEAQLVVTEGPDAHSSLLDLLLFSASAELVGVMAAALDMTVEYLKVRQQFGRPIGSFQALQHRAVDDLVRIVSSRSLVFQVAAQGGGLTSALASAMKAHCSGEALKVTKSAIQMHGGIGFTDEHDIGLYLKRAMLLSVWLGNEALHRQRFAALQAA
jgi:alkylation response protein AidB-like acyl-CoA dehydrogenase